MKLGDDEIRVFHREEELSGHSQVLDGFCDVSLS